MPTCRSAAAVWQPRQVSLRAGAVTVGHLGHVQQPRRAQRAHRGPTNKCREPAPRCRLLGGWRRQRRRQQRGDALVLATKPDVGYKVRFVEPLLRLRAGRVCAQCAAECGAQVAPDADAARPLPPVPPTPLPGAARTSGRIVQLQEAPALGLASCRTLQPYCMPRTIFLCSQRRRRRLRSGAWRLGCSRWPLTSRATGAARRSRCAAGRGHAAQACEGVSRGALLCLNAGPAYQRRQGSWAAGETMAGARTCCMAAPRAFPPSLVCAGQGPAGPLRLRLPHHLHLLCHRLLCRLLRCRGCGGGRGGAAAAVWAAGAWQLCGRAHYQIARHAHQLHNLRRGAGQQQGSCCRRAAGCRLVHCRWPSYR